VKGISVTELQKRLRLQDSDSLSPVVVRAGDKLYTVTDVTTVGAGRSVIIMVEPQ
jgi:hypothetical protein